MTESRTDESTVRGKPRGRPERQPKHQHQHQPETETEPQTQTATTAAAAAPWRSRGFVLFVASLVLFVVHAAEGPPWLDGSELVATSHLLAVPHPTGEPVYLLLAKLVQFLPFGHPAVQVAWLSALFGALAVERGYRIAVRSQRLCGLSAPAVPVLVAILLAATEAIWLISHRAEVYTLTLWLLLTNIHLALVFRQEHHTGAARLGGLVFGLALATHPYLAVLAFPALLLFAGRRLFAWRLVLGVVGFACLGLSTYGLLALRGTAGGLIGWGDTSTWTGFWDVILGRAFAGGFAAPLASDPGAGLAVFFANQFGVVATVPVFALAVWGLVVLLRHGHIAVTAGIVAAIGLGLGSRGLWPFEGDTPDTAGYFALPLALVIIAAGVATAHLIAATGATAGKGATHRADASVASDADVAGAAGRPADTNTPASADQHSWQHRLATAGIGALCLLLSASMMASTRPGLEGTAGRELVLRTLDRVEPNALVLLSDYNVLFMTWYLQAVEGVRPDVTVIYRGFLAQAWYQRRLAQAAPDAAQRLDALFDDQASRDPGFVYTDYGIDVDALPASIRHKLVPAGIWFQVGGTPQVHDNATWLLAPANHAPGAAPDAAAEVAAGTAGLDRQTRRALVWLHVRHACFYLDRKRPASARWHAQRADALLPGLAVADAIASGGQGLCGPTL